MGDWNRENGHRETIKIVGTDIARLDNARPYRKGGHRETWQRGTRSNWGVQFYAAWNIINFIYQSVLVFFVLLYTALVFYDFFAKGK